jgi:hypothetical protein
VLTAAVLAGTANATTSPTVRFSSLTPVVKVRGAHFVPSERVQVVLDAGGAKLARLARASSTGAFTIELGALGEKDRCGTSISIVAAGRRGDRAVYELPQLECPTTTTDGSGK